MSRKKVGKGNKNILTKLAKDIIMLTKGTKRKDDKYGFNIKEGNGDHCKNRSGFSESIRV